MLYVATMVAALISSPWPPYFRLDQNNNVTHQTPKVTEFGDGVRINVYENVGRVTISQDGQPSYTEVKVPKYCADFAAN